ncbi:MAG: tRNA (guanosine(46)-N7)-methyltransferase TrmB [Magnetococcus sp. DMHC-8]
MDPVEPLPPATGAADPLTDPTWIPRGRKQGKIGPQARERLERLLPHFLLPGATERSALLTAWGADPAQARLILEIGFGNGQALATWAARHPQDRFIGVEVFLGGVAALLWRIQQEGLTNIRLATRSIHAVLWESIPADSLDQVFIHFPDPWPKRCHHKRRLVQPLFLDRLATRLRPGGQLSLATDWPHYAQWMRDALAAQTAFHRPDATTPFDPEPAGWVETRFQRKAREAGRTVFHLLCTRTDGPGQGTPCSPSDNRKHLVSSQ